MHKCTGIWKVTPILHPAINMSDNKSKKSTILQKPIVVLMGGNMKL